MPTTTQRTLSDRAAGVYRQIRALTRDTTELDPTNLGDFLRLRDAADAALTAAVLGCRDNGATDAEIAAAIGTTRQNVSKRWPGGGRYVGAAGRYRTSAPKGEPCTQPH